MDDNQTMKEQLLQMQKMASLGMISAGIAHEIQNPLNFVINFSKLSGRLLADLEEIINEVKDQIDEEDAADLSDISRDLALNMQKIQEHGERAISIIQGILLISRGKENEHISTDIPHLVHEYVWLSYHAKRANDKGFNVSIKEDYQPEMPNCMVIPQDLSRAVINVMNNACYAVKQKAVEYAANGNDAYVPTIEITVRVADNRLVIVIADNGTGMSEEVRKKLFQQTITTKPIGEGTGLGMQITHEIITKNHNGEIKIESTLGEGTTVSFEIPM